LTKPISKTRSKPVSQKEITRIAIAQELSRIGAVDEEVVIPDSKENTPSRKKTVASTRSKTKAKTTNAKGKPSMSKKRRSPKLFVLDTNVLLHDPTAIFRFEENDLAIPITVLEEIDRFKKGTDTINFHAREVARNLDELASKGGLTTDEGVPLGDGRGSLKVTVGGPLHKSVRDVFLKDSPDHRILSNAVKTKEKYTNRDVYLISKDVSLRLKAKSLGLQAEDYENDKVPELDKLYTGRFVIEHLPGEIIDDFYQMPFQVPLEKFEMDPPHPNAYFILKGEGKSALAKYDAIENALVRIEKRSGYGINPRNSEQTFAMDALTDPHIQLVTLSGKAGTGKTLLALAGAMECRRKYGQIYLARPVVPLGQQEIGYLPGDIEEKLDPFMQPLWDNLSVIRSQYKQNDAAHQTIQKMLEMEKLKISALAYIRGRSLNRVFFIVDEAQNLTGHEVKTIITRAGEGTKIVLTGDPYQIDSPYLDSRSNGLTRLIDRMKGQGLYAHVTLEKGERSQLSDLASSLL